MLNYPQSHKSNVIFLAILMSDIILIITQKRWWSAKDLRHTVEAAVHFIDLLELFDVFDCHINFVVGHEFSELCVGGDEHIAAVKFADVEEVDNKLFLLLVGGLYDAIALSR